MTKPQAQKKGEGEDKKQTQTQTKPKYDPHFTDHVIAATGPNAHPRLAQIMPSLLRHLHDFAREVDLTVGEWMAGVEMINEAGRMSDPKRNETGMLCDILGLESLVDEITSKQQQLRLQPSSSSSTIGATMALTPTPSAILGPFYRAGAPSQLLGTSILNLVLPAPPGRLLPPPYCNPRAMDLHGHCLPLLTRITGRIRSASTGLPIASGATLEVWQSAPNGLYDQQDPLQPDMNLRGRFRATTTEDDGGYVADVGPGFYSLVCLKPTAYPIPDDGPAGQLLGQLDRHPFRPGHIHFVVAAPGYRRLVTQVFDRDDPYVKDDAVFAVKEELLVTFLPLPPREDADGDGEDDEQKEKPLPRVYGYMTRSSGEMDMEQLRDMQKRYRPRWQLEFDFALVEE